MGKYRLCVLVLVASIAATCLNCGVAPQTPAAKPAGTGTGAAGSGTTGSGSSSSGSTGAGSSSSGSTGAGSSGSGSTGSGSSQQNTLKNIHQHSGWTGYALLPSAYTICSACSPSGPQAIWSMTQNEGTPALSGNSSQFDIGGDTPFGDILWNKHLIGDPSSEDLPDPGGTLNAATHNFTYDVQFYGNDISVSQALEFDINQFVGGQSFIWGHECRIAGGHEWDVWDDQIGHWHPTGIACNPVSQAWNHLILQVQRTSDNQLIFESITLNGVTNALNYTTSPTSTTWDGITVNYQMDGNVKPQAYSIWLDDFNFSYW